MTIKIGQAKAVQNLLQIEDLRYRAKNSSAQVHESLVKIGDLQNGGKEVCSRGAKLLKK